MLLLLLACRSPVTPVDTTRDTEEPPPPVDADGDGAFEADDCDDADASVFPGAVEVCDGRDEDCDGEVDDGVPTDGAGCVDPGPPAWDDAVDVVHVTTRTATGLFDGTNDVIELCVGGRCFPLDAADRDDLEAGAVDVFSFEGAGVSRAAVADVTLRTTEGGDVWKPTCLAVALDGEPVYCRRDLDVKIGTGWGDQASFSDALASSCTTCDGLPLTHGPMIGAVEPDAARIWFRTDATRRAELRVATSEGALAEAAPVHVAYPAADRDFTHVVRVSNLAAGTWHYDVTVDGVRHGPWSFSTAPPPGRLRLAFGSCTKDDDQPIFGTIAAQDPDLFLFVGDNHYGDTDDLQSLRASYRWAHGRPLRRDLLPRTSILATWDDHDFVGNNTDGSAPGKDVALRVFDEYWANPGGGTDEIAGTFFRHRVGDVELFVLDDRYWRGLDGSMFGEAQEAWLVDAVSGSDTVFKLLVSGSQWTTHSLSDSMADFPEARQRLFESLRDHGVSGVVLLSGDIHRSELRLIPGVDAGQDFPEITSSPLATWNSPCLPSPEVRDCYVGDSFVLLDVDTVLSDPSLTATILDVSGNVKAEWEIRRSELEP